MKTGYQPNNKLDTSNPPSGKEDSHKKERELLNKTVELHNQFCNMQRMYPSEMQEWDHAIHVIQNMIAYRIAANDHKDVFYSPNSPNRDLEK